VVGDKIVFSSDVDTPGTGQFDLYSMKPDGSGITRLTTNTLYDAFTSDRMPSLESSRMARPAVQRGNMRRMQGMRAHHTH
jgi:Tol biopolymer transport system component